MHDSSLRRSFAFCEFAELTWHPRLWWRGQPLWHLAFLEDSSLPLIKNIHFLKLILFWFRESPTSRNTFESAFDGTFSDTAMQMFLFSASFWKTSIPDSPENRMAKVKEGREFITIYGGKREPRQGCYRKTLRWLWSTRRSSWSAWRYPPMLWPWWIIIIKWMKLFGH